MSENPDGEAYSASIPPCVAEYETARLIGTGVERLRETIPAGTGKAQLGFVVYVMSYRIIGLKTDRVMMPDGGMFEKFDIGYRYRVRYF